MASERRYMNRINGWGQIAAGVTANAAGAEHLAPGADKLQELRTRAIDLSGRQASLTTAKQEATRELRQVLREGDALADFLRTGARAHFGADSEKMIEFGMQPFRGRRVKPETPEVKAEAPDTQTPEPAQ